MRDNVGSQGNVLFNKHISEWRNSLQHYYARRFSDLKWWLIITWLLGIGGDDALHPKKPIKNEVIV